MEIQEPYDALRRKWIRARQILRSLTPEAGEVYQFYVEQVAKLDAQFMTKKPLGAGRNWPRASRSAGLRKKKEKIETGLVDQKPIEFRITF